MKLKLFNRKPKVAKTDFTVSLLPKNRKEQFFDIVKNRFFTILYLGFILLLFFIPFILAFLFKDILISSANASLSGTELTAFINMIKLIFGAIYIPCFVIFSFGIAGTLKVIRRFAYNEPVFLKDDFFCGIKENWKSYLISSVLMGLFTFLAIAIEVLFGNNTNMAFVQYIPLGFNLAIVYPILIQTMFVSAIYDNKYALNFKLSLHIALRSLLYLLVFSIIIYAFVFYRYISLATVKYILIIVSVVFILPFFLLAFWLSEIHVFDKIVNTTYYPELLNKGLFNYIEQDKKEN